MKKEHANRDWAVVAVMTFIAGAVIAWALTSDQATIKFTSRTEWAAWVQAIGSVAAICVAIYVPWRQRQQAIDDQKRLERQKIRIMAGALSAAAGQYRGSLSAAYAFLDKDHKSRRQVPDTGIRRPVEFDQFRAELYLLGDIGERVNILIASHTTMSGAAKAINDAPTLSVDFLKFANRKFPELIELATDLHGELGRVSRVQN